MNIYNCTFVLDLPEQAITAHRVQVSDAQFSMKVEHRSEKMTIGAGAVSVSRGEVRLNRKPDAPRALVNDDSDVLIFPASALKIRQFSWINDHVQIARLRGKVRGDPLNVRRFELHLDKPEIELGGKVRFSTRDISGQLKPLGIESIHGPIDVEVEGFGEVEAFNGRVELVSPQMELAGQKMSAISLTATKNQQGVIEIKDVEVHYGGGRINGHGGYHIDGEHGWADLWIEEFDWTTLPVDVPEHIKHAVAGRVSGHLHARILDALQEKPQANFALDASLARHFPKRFGLGDHVDVTVTAELEDDEITLNRFLLNGAVTASPSTGSTTSLPPKLILLAPFESGGYQRSPRSLGHGWWVA